MPRLFVPKPMLPIQLRLPLALLLVTACSHAEGFESHYTPGDQPINTIEPIRLTLNPGEDQFPSWTPDGRSILYSFVEPVSGDRCLGQMPGGGGQVNAFRCPGDDPANDSLDMAIEPMMRGEGQIAWVELHSAAERQIHDGGSMFVGTLDPAQPRRRVWHFPYLAQTGTVHIGAINLRWLPNDRLLYIGVDYLIRAVCFGCKPDTVLIARDGMLLDVAQANPVPVPIPGTAEVTSLWPTADSSGFYYTIAGDTRVWLRPVQGGQASVVHDFGSAGIVRDVSVVGQQLAAIVGGKVNYGFEESIGLRQLDSGGVITMVNLADSSETVLSSLLYKRAVLSPDGRAIVAERVTAPSTHPDIWLLPLH